MTLHQASGRTRLGLAFALATAAMWATLPLALKLTLEQLDPYTLTWARFAFAAIALGAWLAWRGRLGQFRGLSRRHLSMLAAAGVLLTANYVLYLIGVQYTTPGNAQLLIQAAPLGMAIGGILIFRERYNGWQWLGMAAVVLGMAMFFSDQWRAPGHAHDDYLVGAASVLLAALAWGVYAMLQKQLLMRLDASATLWLLYVMATLLLWPFARPSTIWAVDTLHAALLAYCALNTLAAYGAFAEALQHWQASRVSAILALTPILCVWVVDAAAALWPGLVLPEAVTMIGWAGAGLVVVGSALSALARDRGVQA